MNPGDFTTLNKSLVDKIKFRQWQATVFSFEKRGYIERIKVPILEIVGGIQN